MINVTDAMHPKVAACLLIVRLENLDCQYFLCTALKPQCGHILINKKSISVARSSGLQLGRGCLHTLFDNSGIGNFFVELSNLSTLG